MGKKIQKLWKWWKEWRFDPTEATTPDSLTNKRRRASIIEKVKEREFEKRCYNAGICPDCGGNLGEDDDVGKVCRPCNRCFPFL